VLSQEAKFSVFKERVNQYIDSILPSGDATEPQSLYAPMRYAMSGNGKRVRPLLLLLACDALNGPVEAALPAAAAVELMHNFTLVHDDMMDRDETRRGRPTVHRQWNNNVALLAGDALLVLAYRSLLRTHAPNLQRLAQVFTDGIIEICEGQALDLDFEQREDITLAHYLDMIRRKTARLLAICAEMGALIAGANDAQTKLFRQFGEHLGLGFQIQDDLLDITVSQKILGKDFGSDVKRRKRPLVCAGQRQRGAVSSRQPEKALQKSTITQSDILAVQQIFYAAGAVAAAEAAVRQNSKKPAIVNAARARCRYCALLELVEMILRRKA
jgi:geranylgeranyl diphosphate synthase type II